MKKEKKYQNLNWAKNRIESATQEKDTVYFNSIMSDFSKDMANFAKEQKIKNEEKTFNAFSKIFKSLAKYDKKNKAFISIFYDESATITKEDKHINRFKDVIDFSNKKYKIEPCKVTHKLDGTITLIFEGITLTVPKKYWEEYEEVKKN